MYKFTWIVGWYLHVRNLCSCLSPLYLQQLHHSREAFMETQKEYIVVCRLNKRQWHKENSCWEIHLWKVKPHSKKKKKSILFQSRRQLINAQITYFPNQFLVRLYAAGSQITTKWPARMKAVVALLCCAAHLRAVMIGDCRTGMERTCHMYAAMFYQHRRSVDCCFSVKSILIQPLASRATIASADQSNAGSNKLQHLW